jgi:hypothetical protein
MTKQAAGNLPARMSPQSHPLTGAATIAVGGDAPAYLSRTCGCGCGKTVTVVMHRGGAKQGRVFGQPVAFVHGHNARITRPFVVDPVTGCWLWIASLDKDGYGWSFRDGKRRRAHRDYYERAHGPIPPGMVLDHRCPLGPERRCVNPDHLAVCTNAENVRRGHEARREREEWGNGG